MKRYQFRLAALLRVRRLEEEQAQNRLRQANSALAEALATRDRARDRCRALVEGPAPVTLDDLRAQRLEGEIAAAFLRECERRVNEAASAVVLAQITWSAAARKVGVVERLDERRREEYLADVLHQEIVETDDLVTARYVTAAGAQTGVGR